MWTKRKVKGDISSLHEAGFYLGGKIIQRENRPLYDAARRLFGSWKRAIEACGINYATMLSQRLWTKDRIISTICKRNDMKLSLSSGQIPPGLYLAATRIFGSWKAALLEAGFETPLTTKWTPHKVLSAIKSLVKRNQPLNYKYISYEHINLLKAAKEYFGSWKAALATIGIDYNKIKRIGIFTAIDGYVYDSLLEGLIANVLFRLKKRGLIVTYERRVPVFHRRGWLCDFLIHLPNGVEMWMEVDSLGKSRNPPYGSNHPKIKYYDECRILYAIVKDPIDAKLTIENHLTLYKIPIADSIVTAHKHPDADAIVSTVAVCEYIRENGKKAYVKLEGDIPEKLLSLFPEGMLIDNVPNVEQIIVLDSGWEVDRIGWAIPDIKLINIDHHMLRKNLHDPKHGIFILDMCSTAAVLVRYFGIKKDYLLAGVYGDTMFSRRLAEVMHILETLGIPDVTAENLIHVTDHLNSSVVWEAIKTAKTHKCRNGFMIVELQNELDQTMLSEVMTVIFRMCDSFVVLTPKGHARLRTANSKVDVSSIAVKFNGGGHTFAASCEVNGQRATFISAIKQIKVSPIVLQKDEEKCEELGAQD